MGGLVHKGLSRIPDRALLLFSGLVYLFLYAPIAVLVFFSFNESRSTQVWGGFSLRWYGELLRDRSVLDAFYNSLVVGVTATAISTVIGTLAALALARHNFRGKSLADSVVYAATVMPEIVVGVSLLAFFVAIQFALGLTTIIIAHVAFTISFVTIVVRARLSGMDRSVEEAAMDLGANPVQTFLRVTLPMILPGVMAGALLAFTLSFDDFVITFFVSGVGSSTLPLKIYSMIKFGVSPVINALSTVVLAATLVFILAGGRFFARGEE
ncbi:binding-protein-dependent transport systems inner membrane component [Rubrobacter xylanophilus DSM 9941]|uniref:Binding-protein-dependent transport systems inner membrane component n=1 Tax=Rubrobacter xylanophilus (strain DSM 9941 / JCM 11954 / NBRC 16129 / PRD-1) TaxID=266117 RepID=Q1AS03_RUBXD|nr:ABC transporter permease [Rubrobacter xylanophilus]ABG05825.1 binding-protein-dependent transport systems inner membrane component [Rubrobacter xylanophilus DSM 9941]